MGLDKYLKVSRLIKRRTVANDACDAGRVMVNDKVVKASYDVKVGDIIEIQFGNKNVRARVTDVKDTVKKEEAKEMFEKGTHFNPVDLVCAVRDYKGHKFNLVKYVDKATGFISYKSKNGKDLKALELPGLWNGAMSDWNTVFVEVPLTTFNPVKTVNDLLREQHQ